MTSIYSKENGFNVWKDESGRLHRDHDLPAASTGSYDSWWQHGIVHRVNGPAKIWFDVCSNRNAYEEWWQHDQLHRLDGPAKIWPNYSFNHWYLHGKDITADVERWIIDSDINKNWREWTVSEKALFALRFR